MVEEVQAVVDTAAEAAEDTLDMAALDEVLDRYMGQDGALIPVLQRAQAIYGYLPSEVLEHISRRLRTPLSQVYGVATFYAQFYLQKRGARGASATHRLPVRARQIITALEKELGVQAGETTPDSRVTLEVVHCLGSCGLSPVAVIDEQVVGRLIPEKAVALVRELA